MLLRLFKSNSPIIIILSTIAGAALWIPAFVGNTAYYIPNIKTDTPLFISLYEFINVSPLVLKGVAFLFILLMAFVLNRLNFKFIFIETKTQLPTFFFILLCSTLPFYQTFHPAMIGSLAFLWAVYKSFPIEMERSSIKQYYEAGFILGIGGLFYLPVGVFLFILWVTQFVFRQFTLREWFASIIGFLTPLVFYFVILFLTNKEYVFVSFINDFISTNRADIVVKNMSLIGIIFIALILFIAFVYLASIIGARKITTRKNFIMMLWIMLYSIISKLVYPFIGTGIVFFFAFPASVILAKYFVELRRKIYGEIAFALLIAASVYTLIVQL